MLEVNIGRYSDFIGGWFIDGKVCDNLINHFEENIDRSVEGMCGGKGEVNKDRKDCREIYYYAEDYPEPIIKYFGELEKVCNLYKQKYGSCASTADWCISGGVKVQRYYPGQHFSAWHKERESLATAHRHLVFLTYLNDVDAGGETEFLYQEIKVKPKRGLTVIWPTDWTHTHRGNAVTSGTKYILTGWYNFQK